MQSEHRTTAILIALLSMPFAVAIYKDATAGLVAVDEYPPEPAYYDDYDSDYDLAILGEEAELSGMGQDFFDTVLFDGGDATIPALSGPIGEVAIGMSLESLSDSYPDYEDWYYQGIPGYDATTSMEFVGDKLHLFQIEIPDDGSTGGILSKQWGPGLVDGDSGGITWFVPSKAVRVSFETDYEHGVIAFTRYQTLEDLIAPEDKLFAFEEQDVFGLSEDQVRDLPDYDYDEASMTLPFLKEGSESVAAWYQLEDNKVVEVSLGLALDSEDQDRVLTLLKNKLGKGKRMEGDHETIHTFRQGKRTIVWTTDDSAYGSLRLERN